MALCKHTWGLCNSNCNWHNSCIKKKAEQAIIRRKGVERRKKSNLSQVALVALNAFINRKQLTI